MMMLSTDSTSAIIMEYKQKFPLLIKPVIQKENRFSKGLKPASFAYQYATAKYIALCEGDDYWTDPDKLQKQVSFLEANPDFVLCYHDCQPFNESGNTNVKYGGAKRDLKSIELQKSTPIFTLTTCFRNLIREFPPEYHMAKFGDLFIWSLLGEHGKGKYFDDILPAMYRVHDGGIFSKQTNAHKIEMQLITRSALFIYHTRQKNKLVAKHFLRKMLISTLKYLSFSDILTSIRDSIMREIRTRTSR